MNTEKESVGSSSPISATLPTQNRFSSQETDGEKLLLLSGSGTDGEKLLLLSGSGSGRLNKTTCFNCKRQGHWARDCPSKLNTKAEPPPAATSALHMPHIQCPCGAGTCIVKTSNTDRNPGRKFYTCPAKWERKCQYFKWCDTLTNGELNSSPKSKYPMCSCGAGICRISTAKTGPDAGRNFFVCPVKKGHGACQFFQWQDQVKTTSNSNLDESRCFSSPQSTLNQQLDTNLTNSCSSREGHFSSEHLERTGGELPVVYNHQNSPNLVVVDNDKAPLIESGGHDKKSKFPSPEHNNPLGEWDGENDAFVPDFPTRELVMPQSKSWDPLVEKAPQVSLLTSQAEICHERAEFWMHITCAGATSSGVHVLGWWGRLAFRPSRCLTVPLPGPFYCCIFPSFDPIFVPWDADVFDVQGSITLPQSSLTVESEKISLHTSSQDHQFSSGVLLEPSGLDSPPSIVQGSIMTRSILEAFGQAAVQVQDELITLLESMDPVDHEAMVQEANSAFAALNCLSVDYRPFHKCVSEYISCASSLAKIEESECDKISCRELVDWYNCEKVCFDDINAKAMAAVTASKECLQLLREEASRVRNLLMRIENQLSCYETYMVDIETCLVQISEGMSESNRILQDVSQEVAETFKKCQQREEERIAARAALEKARVQLRQ